MTKNYFTQEGYEKLQEEKKRLQTERKGAIKELQRARELGDLSENGLYKATRVQVSHIDQRLEEIDYHLKTARIIQHTDASIISLGSTITVQTRDQQSTYQIVGRQEANSLEGKISDQSPLGKLLLGKKVGDEVVLEVGERRTKYTVVQIK